MQRQEDVFKYTRNIWELFRSCRNYFKIRKQCIIISRVIEDLKNSSGSAAGTPGVRTTGNFCFK